jgi:serine/threonine-protein kinase
MSGPHPDVSCDFETRVSRGLADSYELEQFLTSCQLFAAFRARDLRNDRSVAIKVLRPWIADGVCCADFLDAIRLEGSLEHPGIVPVLECGEANGLPYCVTPFVEGECLEARLEREPWLALEEAVRITSDVSEALTAAHQEGVLHGDVKPASILLGEERAELADFGVARAMDEAGARCFSTGGLPVGILAYMSPERGVAETPLDSRSDQYSLACVLHHMLAGEPPFHARSPKALLYTHAVRDPPHIRDFRPDVPWAVERVVLTALSKDRRARFRNVESFAYALETAASGDRQRVTIAKGTQEPPAMAEEHTDPISYRLSKSFLDHPGRLTMAVLVFGVLLVALAILVTLGFLMPTT